MGEVVTLLVWPQCQHTEMKNQLTFAHSGTWGPFKNSLWGMTQLHAMLLEKQQHKAAYGAPLVSEFAYEFWACDFDLASESNLNWRLDWQAVNQESWACIRNVSVLF